MDGSDADLPPTNSDSEEEEAEREEWQRLPDDDDDDDKPEAKVTKTSYSSALASKPPSASVVPRGRGVTSFTGGSTGVEPGGGGAGGLQRKNEWVSAVLPASPLKDYLPTTATEAYPTSHDRGDAAFSEETSGYFPPPPIHPPISIRKEMPGEIVPRVFVKPGEIAKDDQGGVWGYEVYDVRIKEPLPVVGEGKKATPAPAPGTWIPYHSSKVVEAPLPALPPPSSPQVGQGSESQPPTPPAKGDDPELLADATAPATPTVAAPAPAPADESMDQDVPLSQAASTSPSGFDPTTPARLITSSTPFSAAAATTLPTLDVSPLPPPYEDPKGFPTITSAELASIKPHPDAYYEPDSHTWYLFSPVSSRSSDVDSTRIELFRRSDTIIDPSSLSIPLPLPFPPARPDKLHSPLRDDEVNRRPTLRTLEGTLGTRVVVTDERDEYDTVVPRGMWKRLGEEQKGNPLPGESELCGLVQKVYLIFRVIDGVLISGQPRGVTITSKVMSRRFPGFSDLAQDIFIGILGFSVDRDKAILLPPKIDTETEGGKASRARLLRCWLELGMWVECMLKQVPELRSICSLSQRIELVPAKPILINKLGGDKLARRPAASNGWHTVGSSNTNDPSVEEMSFLGLVPDVADEVVAAVFKEQKALMPLWSFRFLGALFSIANTRSSEPLHILVAEERSNGGYTSDDLTQAYNGIGAGSGDEVHHLDDEHISFVFSSRYEEVTDPVRRRVLKEALTLIARHRNSEFLHAIAASVGEDESKPKMDLDRAYRVLEIPKDADDDGCSMAYTVRLMDAPNETEKFKEALTAIAEDRKSEVLLRIVRGTGEDGPTGPSDRPVGLSNIANTCYLNSLLQYFFTVRELRETILNFGSAPGAINGDQLNRVGGRLVTKAEVERSQRFVVLLQGLFNQLMHAESSAVTPETELAYLALVPSKEEIEAKASETDIAPAAAMEAGLKSPSVLGKRGSDHLEEGENDPSVELDAMTIDSSSARSPPADRESNMQESSLAPVDGTPRVIRQSASPKLITETLDPFFSEDQLTAKEGADGVVEIGAPPDVEMANPPPPPPLPPRERKKPDLEQEVSTYMSFGKQNDVTECMDNVMFQIECALNPILAVDGDASNLLKSTFYGKMRQQLKIDDPNEKEPLRVQEEPFFSLLVDVAQEGRNLYDGLDTVFDDSLVDIEGKQARRQISLVEVPPILQVQLQRVQYNRELKKIFKSNAHLAFGETISMDRYLEVDPDDVEGIAKRERTNEYRRELEQVRARLQHLTHQKDSNIGQVMREAYAHIVDFEEAKFEQDDISPTLTEAADLEKEIADLKESIITIRNNIEQLWEGSNKAGFELVSVFIHRGTALSGHYYIYIRDSKDPKRWLKYNDSLVTDVDADEVFSARTGDTNPYFLVYCRKDRIDSIDSRARAAS